MGRVDAHCHLWDLSRGDYDWLDVNNPDLAPIARDFGVDDLAPQLVAADVDHVVVVQAAASEAETDYLLSLSDKHSEIGGVVGWVDLLAENAGQVLADWAVNPKFKGIRPMLQGIEADAWLIDSPPKDIWHKVVQLGLRFDALVQPRHLEVMLRFCQENSELRVVIDHAAKPKDAFAGDARAFEDWSRNMRALGQNSQAYCKVSGLLTELDAHSLEDPLPVLKPVFDVLLESFGPARLMWGSDWPVLRLASDYTRWNALTFELLAGLSDDDRSLILGGTATQFYGLEDAA